MGGHLQKVVKQEKLFSNGEEEAEYVWPSGLRISRAYCCNCSRVTRQLYQPKRVQWEGKRQIDMIQKKQTV